MADGYWSRVARRAFAETLVAFRLDSPSKVAASVLAASLGVGAIWLVGGFDDAIRSQTLKWLYGAAGIIFAFPIILLIRLLTAPADMDREAAAQLAALQATQDGQTKRLEKRDSLAYFLDAGNELFLAKISTTEEFDSWLGRVKAWHETVCAYLDKNISKADRIAFQHAPGLSLSYSRKFSPEHENALNWLRHHLDRLTIIMDRV